MSWFSRFRNAIRPQRLDDDLADEMRDHIERKSAALRAEGLADAEAQRQAESGFGNVTKLREQSREFRLWPTLESTLQDVRYAWRGMRKNPAFSVTAVLSLGLAIGANTAIYSIVDAAILRPLPVPEPEQLITVTMPDIEQPGHDASRERETFSYPIYQQFRTAAGKSARLALFGYTYPVEAQLWKAGAPTEKANRQFVSGDAFGILGIPPALGRVFSQDDDRVPGGHPVAVISQEYWQRRFHGDPAALGQRLRVDGKEYSIIGVAREGFSGIEPGKFVDVWLPSMMYDKDSFTRSGWGWFRIMGRLAPGATRAQLQARLQPLFHFLQEEGIKGNPALPPAIQKQLHEMQLRVHSGSAGVSGFRPIFARPLWIILSVAALLLLVACANVANLLLARFTARSKEIAMRVSLGAGRLRLARQFLTESLLLSAMAGVFGWMVARASAPALVNSLSRETDPVRFTLAMDTRVLLFCLAVSTLAAVSFGLLPAWKKPVGPTAKLRLGRFFVGVQVAFAFCLVMAGASFLFTLQNLFAVDTGFHSRGVAVFQLNSFLTKTPEEKKHWRALVEQLQRRVGESPGVQAANVTSWPIFTGAAWTDQVLLPGKRPSEREELFYQISPGYFATLQTALLSGRDFTLQDSETPKIVPTIVNEAFARKYFGAENPLGKTFQHPNKEGPINHQVVGIAANAYYSGLRDGVKPLVYVPLNSPMATTDQFSLYVRSSLDLGSVARLVEREANTIGSGIRVREITTLDTLVGNSLLREKLLAGIGGVFAFLGLLLAAIGLFGLLNYSVARRTKEIGIRAALGARRGELVLLVLKDLGAMVGAGLLVGLAGSLGLLTFLQSLLFGIKQADPLVIASAMSIFLLAAFAAGALPANRAAGVDPMIALRQE